MIPMLTLICLFGLAIHRKVPRRDLDQKSRTTGSECCGAERNSLFQLSVHLPSTYYVHGIDQALSPVCANEVRFYR